MRFISFASLVIFAATEVSATCWEQNGNFVWGNRGRDISDDTWDTVCTHMKGTYHPGAVREQCFMDDEHRKWDVRVMRKSGGFKDLLWEECKEGLSHEAESCPYGGENTHNDGWYYKAICGVGACTNLDHQDREGSS